MNDFSLEFLSSGPFILSGNGICRELRMENKINNPAELGFLQITHSVDLVTELCEFFIAVSVVASLRGASYDNKQYHLGKGNCETRPMCRLTRGVGLGVDKDDETVISVTERGDINVLALVVPTNA